MAKSAYKWDDLRVFLAIVRHKSATKAAAHLDMTQATVSRRLNTLEDALGHLLFVRTPEGMLTTELAQMLIPIAEQAEQASLTLENTVRGFDEEPRGLVRIALPEDICSIIIVPQLPDLIQRYPDLQIEMLTGSMTTDLMRLEADIAIRLVRPTRGDLRVQRINTFGFAIYASPEYINGHDPSDLASLDWIDWSASLSHIPDARWLRENLPTVVPKVRSNSMRARRNAVLHGIGAAILPDEFERLWPNQLVRLPNPFGPMPVQSTWLVGHAQTRYAPHIRAVWDYIVETSEELRAQSAPNNTDTDVLNPS